MARPVAFAAPADIELDPDPIRADWVIEGSPKARSKYLAGSADGAASVMAVDESAVARDVFGDEVVDHYVRAAQIEVASYGAAVTDWERYRGFERL